MPDNIFPARVVNIAANPIFHNISIDHWHYGRSEAYVRSTILAGSVQKVLSLYFESKTKLYDV